MLGRFVAGVLCGGLLGVAALLVATEVAPVTRADLALAETEVTPPEPRLRGNAAPDAGTLSDGRQLGDNAPEASTTIADQAPAPAAAPVGGDADAAPLRTPPAVGEGGDTPLATAEGGEAGAAPVLGEAGE